MNFEEWLNETEGFNFRVDNWKEIKSWLKAAFDVGYEAGEMNKQYLIQSLKAEIRTQRQEIAALREEPRLLINKDLPPGYTMDSFDDPIKESLK